MISNDNEIHKIGVIILGLMGDVLIRTPIIKNLRTMFADAKIVAIADKIGVEILKNNPDINKIIQFHRTPSNKLKNNLFKIYDIWQVRKEKFDMLVNIYDGGSSPIVALLSGAKYRLGITNKIKGAYTVTHTINRQKNEKHHIGLNFLKVLLPLNKKINYDTTPIFTVTKIVIDNIKQRFFDINFNQTYMLNIATGDPKKIFELNKYFQIIQYIYDKYQLLPAIVCNPQQEYLQRDLIDKISNRLDIPYIMLPILNIEKLGALMKLFKFIITPDTGLLHVAIALNIPTLAIFTYTNPKLVDPQKQNFVSCFIPVYAKNLDNLFFGTKNIDINYLYNRIDKLLPNFIR